MPGTLVKESVGPVDVAVISFEGNQFNGDVAPALMELQDNGTVRIIDLTFVRKDTDGTVDVVEVSDSGVSKAFEKATNEQFALLSEEDLENIGDDLDAGSSAMVIVWENAWAARLAAALRGSHAEVLSLERIPRETVLQAITALDQE